MLLQEPTLNVLIFKTNIHHDDDVDRITKVMALEPGIKRWTVDRMDIDRVLRIESDGLASSYIIDIICAEGYCCEELPD